MAVDLKGKRVAILATDGFETSELTEPKNALEQAGATTSVVSTHLGEIHGWQHKEWHKAVKVDWTVEEVSADQFDALLLPGGVMNPDQLRTNPLAVRFVRQMFEAGKPIGAICHGPWMLAEAGVVRGRAVTSWPSLQTDLRNAGGIWTDEQVVVDDGLVTSRKPGDIEAFCERLCEQIAQGVHVRSLVQGRASLR